MTMEPFDTISEAEDWMDDNASGPMSVLVKTLNILEVKQYSIPPSGFARVTLTWWGNN